MRASTVSCTCVVSRCRTAWMPCTLLHWVGTLRSSSSCCLCLEKESMRRQTNPIPCCTLQPRGVTVRWHATSLTNNKWNHRTGTRCLGARGLCWCQSTRSKCVTHVCMCVSLCSMLWQTDVTWTCLHNAVAESEHAVLCFLTPVPLLAFWLVSSSGSLISVLTSFATVL